MFGKEDGSILFLPQTNKIFSLQNGEKSKGIKTPTEKEKQICDFTSTLSICKVVCKVWYNLVPFFFFNIKMERENKIFFDKNRENNIKSLKCKNILNLGEL